MGFASEITILMVSLEANFFFEERISKYKLYPT